MWRFRLCHVTPHTNIMFGVGPIADVQHDTDNLWTDSKYGWYFHCNRSVLTAGGAHGRSNGNTGDFLPAPELRIGQLKYNDVITMQFDSNRRTLSFGINSGETTYTCFRDIPSVKSLCLIVQLCSPNNEFELLEYQEK